MEFQFTKENLDYQAKARELACTVVKAVAADLDKSGEYPWVVLDALKREHLMGVWIPREYGGLGAGALNLCLIIEELSRACGGVGVSYAVNALGSFPLLLGGTEAQKQLILPRLASGEHLIAFALSEQQAGSDPGSLTTAAERTATGYKLTGAKKWTTNANAATFYTVFAVTDSTKGSRGLSAFIVQKGTPGFTIGKREDLLGIRCVPVHELQFQQCHVQPSALLGEKEGLGFFQAMATLDRARPGVAAQAVGLAQGALDLALEYCASRKQFGQAIASFQGIQFMVADMATKIEAARQLVYTAARAIDAGAKNIAKLAAMAKLYATDTAMEVTTNALQLFGGYGYCTDYPIEKYMRDAKITQIYEGTNQIQRLVIARALMRDLQKTMEPQ